MGKHIMTIAVALIIAAILLMYLVCFQVREAEIAIVTTFGKAESEDVKTDPGLYWKWPWPVQKVYRLDGRLHVFEGTFEELLTKDGRNLTITACAGWRIKTGADKRAPLRFLESLGTVEAAEAALASLVRNQKSAVLGQYDLKNLVSVKEDEMKFDDVEKELIRDVRKLAGEKYGVDVVFARIKRLSMPTSVTAKVFERMKKEREREVEVYRGEGEGRANDIKNRAENARKRIVARADAEARLKRAEGEREAAEYLAVLAQNPELALFLRQVDALRKLKERTTYVLDANTPPYNLLQQGHASGGTPQVDPKVVEKLLKGKSK